MGQRGSHYLNRLLKHTITIKIRKFISFHWQGAADSSNDAIRTFICTTICPASNQSTVLQGWRNSKNLGYFTWTNMIVCRCKMVYLFDISRGQYFVDTTKNIDCEDFGDLMMFLLDCNFLRLFWWFKHYINSLENMLGFLFLYWEMLEDCG